VADLLGANHAPLDVRRFPHSAITFSVYAEFRESQLQHMLLMAQLSAFGPILGNSFLDLRKSSKHISDLYSSLYRSIPYMSGAHKVNSDTLERKEFIKQYWDMHKQIKKQPDNSGAL